MRTLLPWVIWALSAIFVVFNYMQQIFPNVVATELMTSLSANENMLSSIAAAYFYVYAVLQIPAGMIIDRFNVKRPLILAITGSAIGALFFQLPIIQ